ncbi:hypothetical protein OGATHE_001976 [Ogataea polymorpha]|uniref:Uncharacterized protein n=1 Tax=Ogataea polymorpha TaxID=460523 RepID=A0A9P8TCE4_9ASCO|nr:hypothetical protein OGATHE_001976 [Ogataea polymorpha]
MLILRLMSVSEATGCSALDLYGISSALGGYWYWYWLLISEVDEASGLIGKFEDEKDDDAEDDEDDTVDTMEV